MPSPSLTGLNAPTFNENTVNATAQVIDSDVTFTDADNDFNGGTLVVSGLLAQDTVSILSGAIISLSAGTVYYDADGAGGNAAVAIGTASGGAGATFTVTFNASATSVMIDALIENLTYANSSNAPTASRTLTLQVTDAAHQHLFGATSLGLVTTGSPLPTPLGGATPAVALFPFSGGVDLMIGGQDGKIRYYFNSGSAGAPVFTATGFTLTTGGTYATPAMADVDGDGDYDLVTGTGAGGLLFYRQDLGGIFSLVATGSSPFGAITSAVTGTFSAPTFVDLDGDGDVDLFVGRADGTLLYFKNTGNSGSPTFTLQSGASNPFNGVDVGGYSSVTFADLDGDGDLDAVLAHDSGQAVYYRNDGSAASPVFALVTGAASPVNGIGLGSFAVTTLGDIDGDGDVDLVIASTTGLAYYRNAASNGIPLTINVTAQNDAPTATGLPTDVTITEDTLSTLNLSSISLTDVDSAGAITVVMTASSGTVTATTGGGVSAVNSGATMLTLTGTATAIDTFLNTATNIRYIPVSNLNGDNAATLTITANDGTGAVTLGVVNIDITPVNDAPVFNQFNSVNTYGENSVNAAPQTMIFGVVVSDAEGNFNGGHLTITGVAPEDTFAFTDQGVGAGQIHVDSAGLIFYGGLQIGTANLPGAIAAGTGLDITFNANATGASISALLNDLTFRSSNDTPVANVGHRIFFTLSDSTGASVVQTSDIFLIPQNDAPTLSGLSSAVTFLENTVNAAPQIIDSAVVFGDPEANLNGGHLIISGLLAEDTITFAEQGNGAGQIHIDGMGSVFYGGVQIGIANLPGVTATGATLDITFTAGATVAAINALIQDMTYANSSDTPTATRDLTLTVSDGSAASKIQTITINVTSEADGIVGTTDADTLTGTAATDTVNAGAGDDYVDGGGGDDILNGGDGADYLRGGSGSDSMQGGAGDDTYVVTDAGDTADETGGDGTDLVITSQAWTLGTGFENLTLAAPGGAINGTGNSQDNVILGNSFANTLNGLDGNDTLFGDGGADTLNGGDGADSLDGGGQNDTLNGGAGVDTLSGGIGNDALDGGTEADAMTGGAGNDSYIVDDAGDLVTELASEGADTVSASVAYTLTDNVETLTLTGSGDLDGTGNALKNTITGNSGANTLHGGGDIDAISGMDGADSLYGDAGNDVLDGGNGDDFLYGGTGSDRLTGGAGADTFVFTDLDIHRFSAGAGLVEKDTIVDLSFAANDRIDLSAIDANTGLDGDQAFSFVGKFTKVAGQAVLSLSGGITTLSLDVDGDGRADLMISINGDVTGTTANLYTGGGDVNGGWVL